MHNPLIPDASLDFSPLELDSIFPLEIVLDGQRDDQPITQLHIHDALEIGVCLEGSGIFYIGAKIIPFRTGDITVITEREFHRCRSSPGTKSRWAWFFLEPLELLVPHATPLLAWEPDRFSGPEFTNVLEPASYPAISTLANQLICEASYDDVFQRPNLRALFLLLLNQLHRTFAKPRKKTKPDHSGRAFARVAPALQKIANGFHEPLSIPSLAKLCFMSERNFQLQFTKLLGMSPQKHLLYSRIQAAAAMLIDVNRNISDIAFSCGFGTLSSFNRAFKAAYQISPREYRNKQTTRK